MKQSLSRWALGGSIAAVAAVGVVVAQPSPSRELIQRDDPAIELRVTRFWSAAASQTEVLAMVGIPYQLATPTGQGAASRLSYKLTIRVVDEKGVELAMDSSRRTAPASFRQSGAIAMEPLSFLVKPGKYYLTATVVDSVTGKSVSDSVAFDGYTDSPAVSDMLLSSYMRETPANDTTTAQGEIGRGPFRLVGNPEVRIDLTRPSVAFMLEAYAKKDTKANLTVTVSTIAGDPLPLDLKPHSQMIKAGGGFLAGQIPLAGIPQGKYLVAATVAIDGKSTTREVPFTVTDPELALKREAVTRELGRRTDDGFFNALPDDSLDFAAAVLTLLGTNSRELATYRTDLSASAKRLFLIQFWANRNANKTPGAENTERINFYRRVEYINKQFDEGLVPGWKTDRGRIIAKYGTPDDSIRYNSGVIPVLGWKWTKARPFWVIFADKSRNGRFTVMKALDDAEAGNPQWIQLIGFQTVQTQIEPFVGKQFVTTTGEPVAAGGGGGGFRF